MSAASSSSATRRPSPTAPQRLTVRPTVSFEDAPDGGFRIDLGDIPKMQGSLDVEGFRPSLLSRLLDLLSRSRHR